MESSGVNANVFRHFRDIKGTAMKTENAQINYCLRVSKVSLKFRIPTI